MNAVFETGRPAVARRSETASHVWRRTRPGALPPSWGSGLRIRNEFHRLAAAVRQENASPLRLGICSIGAGEGRSWVLAGLACALAEQGHAVTVSDSLTPRPSLAEAFGAFDAATPATTVAGHIGGKVSIVCLNQPAPSAAEAEAALRLLLDNVEDVALLEMAPLRESPQPWALTPLVDGVVLVVAAERERREVIADAVVALRRRSVRVAGVVLNRRVRAIPEFLYRWL